MKCEIALTDLTRMQQGRVCLAGYDRQGRCIRPTLPPPGIPERSLRLPDGAVLAPGVVAAFDLIRPRPQPPHTEDYDYDPASVRVVKKLTDEQRRKVLERSLFPDMAALFEQPIQHGPGHSVQDGQGPRSIGTLRPRAIHQVIYTPGEEGVWEYRLGFYDQQDEYYRLKIVDLTWHYYCDSQRDAARQPADIAATLTQQLKKCEVYLRVGLSRGWKKFPGRCFLQVTAIHTFPDYLQGRTFADLRPTNRSADSAPAPTG